MRTYSSSTKFSTASSKLDGPFNIQKEWDRAAALTQQNNLQSHAACGPKVGPPSSGTDMSLVCDARGDQAGEGSGEGRRSLGIHTPHFEDNGTVKYLWIDESASIVQNHISQESPSPTEFVNPVSLPWPVS